MIKNKTNTDVRISSIAPLELNCQSGDESSPSIPSFEMVAYTGGAMDLFGYMAPVVVDLEGLKVSSKSRPILKDHNSSQIVGHTEEIFVGASNLGIKGKISASNTTAQEIVQSSLNGFPWQASIGARVKRVVFVRQGKSAKANGREFKGPVYVVRKSVLGEVSFVALGADDDSSAHVKASVVNILQEESMEKFNEWLKATYHLDAEELSGEQLKAFQAEYDKVEAIAQEEAAADEPTAKQEEGAAAGQVEAEKEPGLSLDDIRAEQARIAQINSLCVGNGEIAAKAIEENWSVEKTELHVLKAAKVRDEQDSGVKSVAVVTTDNAPGKEEIEAAILMAGGKMSDDDLVAAFDAKVIDKAEKMRSFSFKEMVTACCKLSGNPLPAIGAGVEEWVKAAFSTADVPGILSNIANKTMMASYRAVPSSAIKVSKKLTARDFKEHTGYHLSGDAKMLEVANGGEIKFGTLGEQSFAYAVKTYGRMFGLTRQDIINDDLGAFNAITAAIGRGAGLAREEAFWALVLANTGNFFHASNNNYAAGADTALSIDGLSRGDQLLSEQTDSEGNPIIVEGKTLLTSPAQKALAKTLYVASEIRPGGGSASSKEPVVNIHAGNYNPISTPYLKEKQKEWYLFADPANIAAFGIAYLNGRDRPVVEEVDVSSQFLGRAWRGYFDFGVCQIDHRGAVKLKGEA